MPSCVHSQLVEVSDLARSLHSGKPGHRLVSVWKFQFDESYDKEHRCMVIGGWIAEESEWRRLENQWLRCIERTNAKNRPNQQITRYHASPMNCFDGEFENWTKEMSEEFSANLIKLIKRRMMGIVGVGVDMEALKEVFPEGPADRRENAYTLCIKQIMISLGWLMRDNFPDDQVMIVQDHGDWDVQALAAYNHMLSDLRWGSRRFFHSFTSLSWKQSAGLQACDLVAFETFKRVQQKLIRNTDQLRWAMKQFQGDMPGDLRLMDIRAVRALRKVMEPEQFPDFPGEPDGG